MSDLVIFLIVLFLNPFTTHSEQIRCLISRYGRFRSSNLKHSSCAAGIRSDKPVRAQGNEFWWLVYVTLLEYIRSSPFKGRLPHSDRGCGEWWIWSPNSSFSPQNVILEVVFLWGITSRCMRLRLNAVFHRFHDDSQYQIHQFSRKIVGKSTEEFVSSFLVDQKWNSDHKKCRNQLGSTCRWS